MSRTVVFLALLSTLVVLGGAIQFDVAANQERCFFEEYSADTLVVGEYHVLPGEYMNVEITVYDPKNQVLFRKQDADKGKLAFTTVEAGDYKYCFNNKLAPSMSMSVGLKRRIALDIKTGVDAKDYTEVAKAEQLKPLELELRKMQDTVNAVLVEMMYFRAREEAMRDTNESTNARVMWFSIFVVIVLVGLGLLQVFYMKRYFRSKKLI